MRKSANDEAVVGSTEAPDKAGVRRLIRAQAHNAFTQNRQLAIREMASCHVIQQRQRFSESLVQGSGEGLQ